MRSPLMKFAVGQSVPRKEDPVLVRGEGCYSDDVSIAGQLYRRARAQPVSARRNPQHRHARGARHGGRGCRLYRSGSAGGGLRADFLDHGLPRTATARPCSNTKRAAFATDKVRYIGDPVAIVIAQSAEQARDAVEMVEVDIDPLEAVTEPTRAMAADCAPTLRRRAE